MRGKVQQLGNGIRAVAIVLLVYFVIVSAYLYSTNKSNITLLSDEQLIQQIQTQNKHSVAQTAKEIPEGELFVTANNAMNCLFAGSECGDAPQSNHFSESLIGKATDVLAYPLVNPPASGVYWTMNQLEKAHLIPQTYAAQGIGFTKMQPFASIWLAFRNIAFTLMVLGIVTIGFMVMFRLRINPQVSITLENSLPRIFVSMLLVTFSFAIAGFMIDIMYFIMLTGISVIARADPTGSISPQIEHVRYLNARGGELIDGMWNVNNIPWMFGLIQFYKVGQAIFQVLPAIISSSIRVIAALIMSIGGTSVLVGIVGESILRMFNGLSLLGTTLGTFSEGAGKLILYPVFFVIGLLFAFTWGGGLIMALVMFLTLIILFVRMYVILFQAYIKILLYVIFAPMYILLNIIPGNNAFSSWVRGLAGELSVYPITVFVMLVGKLIYKVVVSSTSGSIWTPPFVWGIAPEPFGIIISFVLLFQVPDIVKFVRMKINGGRQSPINFGLGTLFGAAAVGGGAVGGQLGGMFHQFSMYTLGPRVQDRISGKLSGSSSSIISRLGRAIERPGSH